MRERSFLSLGLDIGTTTTHLVLSRLTVGPGEDAFGRHHLLDRQVVYRSAIHATPLSDERTIDAAAVAAIVEREYGTAEVRPEDVETGAVIVTGEAARKDNAEAVVRELAGRASTFAAAVAGANLEAVLAGRGSGAAEWSKRHAARVLNVDVGGGTTNLAWFERGQLLEAAAIRVGGRHLIRRPGDGERYRVATPTARALLGEDDADATEARRWTQHCVEQCLSAMAGRFDRIPEAFVITRPRSAVPVPDVMFFSGGVGDLMWQLAEGQSVDDHFGDTGLALARALLAAPAFDGVRTAYPPEPIRATVIGAGQFSMTLSGETLWIDASALPLVNLPVLHPFRRIDELASAREIAEALAHRRTLHDLGKGDPVAIVLPDIGRLDWEAVEALGARLAGAAIEAGLASPWVFLMSANFGRLLGASMARATPDRSVIVVDEIDAGNADYVDIGRAVAEGRPIVPVVAKSLLFE